MERSPQDFIFDGKKAYMGNIQVSKAVFLAYKKKADKLAFEKRNTDRHFPRKESNLNDHPLPKTPYVSLQKTSQTSFSVPQSPRFAYKREALAKNSYHALSLAAKESKLLLSSKKITKEAVKTTLPLIKPQQVSRPLTNITNRPAVKSLQRVSKFKLSMEKTISTDFETPKDSRIMDHEDLPQFDNILPCLRQKVTQNYEILQYPRTEMSDEVEFRCFRDNELMIPEDCAKMIIHHELDEDCQTDEEQLGLAVKSMLVSLRLEAEDY